LSAGLEQYFGEIADPRVECTDAHQLLDIIAIALFGVPAGADSLGGNRNLWQCQTRLEGDIANFG
jgi:hypothetical protein